MSLARVLLDLLRERRHAQKLLRQIIKTQEDTMAAIDTLESNVTALTTKTDEVLVKIAELKAGSGNPNEAREQAAADAVAAQTDRLNTAIQ